ncbi:Outer membrane receptor for ferrienterochelin and colicins [Zhouia amylolytica]|uniref:Outer membrane receptor for ferrienterochelin and colicins n=1 Tax=Zhouia amylolytica TaxID=376730 RepID=A0A1I6U1C8_9FLAO|nr:TonB-dependent receptor [Zhouia amylolytica]SFS95077.1 Outer membrane receptor for ferrienterochelin and colicins [Zhouia amylolytica]
MQTKFKKAALKLIYFTAFIFTSFSLGQDIEVAQVALIKTLKEIETTHQVSFSYADETIANITLAYKPQPSLEASLNYIIRNTDLEIKQIDSNNYIITKSATVDICGYIYETFSNSPIEGASVTINGKGTISNKSGYFRLNKIARNSIVKIQSLGYNNYFIEVKKIILKPDSCEHIYMDHRTELLSEVVVYQYLTNGLSKQRSGSIEIITEDFGILPGLTDPDVLQTAQALPGVESISETVSNINIRGGTNDQNLLLWDGIKMYQSGHFFGLISAFNPHLTEKVSIIKNGTSASYTDGVSGTIDIETFNQLKGEAFGGIGFNLISTDGYAHIPLNEKLGIQVSARRSITDWLKTPTYNSFFDRAFQDTKITNFENEEVAKNSTQSEDFFFYDTSLKILYDPNEKHQFRANIIAMNNHLDYEETLTQKDTSETKQSSLDQTNFAFGGSLKSYWNTRFSTTISGYYTNYNLDATNLALETDQRLIQNNEVLELGGKLTTKYKASHSISLLNGYQFYEVGITNIQNVNNPFFYSKIKGVVRNHALFSEMNFLSANKNTYLKLGGRLNYIERFGKFILEPRVSFNQRLNTKFSVEILGEMKNQVTNQIIDFQRDFLGIEKRRWILANNKDLPVTQSKQASIGFNYNHDNLYMAIEGFYKKVDGITTSNQGFQNQNQFQRTSGSYKVNGIEFLINKKTKTFSTWLSYTYNNNNYTFKSLTPATFPNNLDIKHSMSFAGTYTLNSIKFALGANWRTGKPYTKPRENNSVTVSNTGNYINYEEPNSSNLPNYLRTDFSATYKFDFSESINGSIGVSLLNILNEKNTLDRYYRLEDEKSNKIQQVDYVSLGTTPNFSFRIYF